MVEVRLDCQIHHITSFMVGIASVGLVHSGAGLGEQNDILHFYGV